MMCYPNLMLLWPLLCFSQTSAKQLQNLPHHTQATMVIAPSKGQQGCRPFISAKVMSTLHDCLPNPLNPQHSCQADSQSYPIPLPFLLYVSFPGITFPHHFYCCTVRAHFLPVHTTNKEPWSIWGSSTAFCMMDVVSRLTPSSQFASGWDPPGLLFITICIFIPQQYLMH